MKPIPAETRAAVMAALLAGQSISAVSRQFKVGRATISKWRTAAGLGDVTPIAQEKRDEIGGMLIDYLRTTIATLVVQSAFAKDEAWLRQQTGSDLAVAHGVMADKVFRILEALEAGAAARDSADLPERPASLGTG